MNKNIVKLVVGGAALLIVISVILSIVKSIVKALVPLAVIILIAYAVYRLFFEGRAS